MKTKIKVVTYNQMITTLTQMVADGIRKGDEPFLTNGNFVEAITDGRTDTMLCRGELEIERELPPIRV